MVDSSNNTLDPSVLHVDYAAALPGWQKCRDAAEGERAIKQRKNYSSSSYRTYPGTAYLPSLAGQDEPTYNNYRDRANWFNAVGRTIQGLRGMVFRKSPQIDNPIGIDEHIKSISTNGISVTQLAKHLTNEILLIGRAGILVDMPVLQEGEAVQTIDEAEQRGKRPTWSVYNAEAIINWRTEWVNNQKILTRVVLRESVESLSVGNEFATSSTDQIRVLELVNGNYQQRIFVQQENDEKKTEWKCLQTINPVKAGQPLSFIPFVFLGALDLTAQVDKPPLYDLVSANIAHYRNSADYEWGLHWCGIPTPWAAGFQLAPDQTLHLGSSEAWVTENPQARAGFLEFSGQGLGALQQAMLDKKSEMAALGSRVLASEKRAVETAEVAMLHRTGENSILADISDTTSEALTQCLRWHCDWCGIAPAEDECKVRLNQDFFPIPMSPDEVRATMELWQSGALAFSDVVRRLKDGEWITQDRDAEDIIAERETESPSGGIGLVPSFNNSQSDSQSDSDNDSDSENEDD